MHPKPYRSILAEEASMLDKAGPDSANYNRMDMPLVWERDIIGSTLPENAVGAEKGLQRLSLSGSGPAFRRLWVYFYTRTRCGCCNLQAGAACPPPRTVRTAVVIRHAAISSHLATGAFAGLVFDDSASRTLLRFRPPFS